MDGSKVQNRMVYKAKTDRSFWQELNSPKRQNWSVPIKVEWQSTLTRYRSCRLKDRSRPFFIIQTTVRFGLRKFTFMQLPLWTVFCIPFDRSFLTWLPQMTLIGLKKASIRWRSSQSESTSGHAMLTFRKNSCKKFCIIGSVTGWKSKKNNNFALD